jgi:ABC-2 type transport system permease protein
MTIIIDREYASGARGARTVELPDVKPRVSLRQAVANSLTMAHRGLIKIRRTPEQLMDVVAQPVVFTLLFTYLFGGAIAGDVAAYVPFFIPGIMCQSVIMSSQATGVQLREDMDKGVFDRFKSLPIARIAPLAGALIADTIRFFVATVISMAMGFVVGWRPTGGFFGVLCGGLLLIVVSWAISWIFALFGVVARKASTVAGCSMMILMPLTFCSNAFVPTDTMPSWLRAFANVNPVSHLVTAIRELTITGAFSTDVLWSLLGAAVIVAVFAPLTVKAFMRKA